MGYTNWSDAAYQARQNHRHTNNQTAFSYDQQVRASNVKRVHDEMNPYDVMRESRDSDEHPDSVAIAVIFDVTGSMGVVPQVLQTKLGKLMQVLVQHGYVAHPQILFGAVGDANCDAVPLQVGQFESGLEMDDDLGKIYLEGGGGGQIHESYELAIYFVARHTSIDCYNKRGHKGYLFTIGDEKPYSTVRRGQVHQLIGDGLTHDMPLRQIIGDVQRHYEYFHIIPTDTSHGKSPDVQERWRALLGERVLLLDDAATVCETIALAIGLCEGVLDDPRDGALDLVRAGCDADAAGTAAAALTRYAAVRPPVVITAASVIPASGARRDDGRLR